MSYALRCLRAIGPVLLLVCFASMALAERRVALVIGNAAYASVPSLKNPTNDAFDISVALEGLGFEVFLGRDMSKEAMQQITDDFGQAAKTADVALLYYAGHGFQVDGRNYLVPVDAAIASVEDIVDQTLPVGRLLKAMETAPGIKLVFLDACRDNPFGSTPEGGPQLGQGLARAGTEANFMLAYATQPDNVAYDGTGRNSFFTEAMLYHLYTPGQDLSDLMMSVRRDVLASTGGQQIPWENSSLTRPFVFDQSPETLSVETLLYQLASGISDKKLFELYVDTYPQGAHLADAQSFLSKGPTRSLGLSFDPGEIEKEIWTLGRRSRLRPLLEFYVERYPEGQHVKEAKQLIALIPAIGDVSPGGLCERLATHPRDATARNPGVPMAQLRQNYIAAISSCSAAITQSPNLPHYITLLARAYYAAQDDLALELYQSAADRGDLRAMVSLAILKENAKGNARDIPAAVALYEKAAQGGSQQAMINLSVILSDEEYLSAKERAQVPLDPARSTELLMNAAELGSPKATFNLGVMAFRGLVEAGDAPLDYFLRAAKNGYPDGYRVAAIILDGGQGVQPDPKGAAAALLRGVAEDDGNIIGLFEQNLIEWSPDTITEMQSRLTNAGLYTDAIDGVSGPNFISALEKWRNGGFDAAVIEEMASNEE